MAVRVETIDTEVRHFLAENFILDDDGAGLAADASLTQAGVLDSMGVLELIMFIEQQYGLTIPDEDTLPENLDSVARIVAYVSGRLGVESSG
ncbi:MAG: acyl carrier protein [Trueperaceae bacterium]